VLAGSSRRSLPALTLILRRGERETGSSLCSLLSRTLAFETGELEEEAPLWSLAACTLGFEGESLLDVRKSALLELLGSADKDHRPR
jgi:hypothetical protein